MKDLKTPNLETQLFLSVQTGLPVLLEGMPGEAKSSFISALSVSVNRHLETIIASTRDPSDFGGLPKDSSEGIVYAPPAWVNRLIKAQENKGGYSIF